MMLHIVLVVLESYLHCNQHPPLHPSLGVQFQYHLLVTVRVRMDLGWRSA